MKKILFSLLLLFSIVYIVYAAPAPGCTFRTTCLAGETAVLGVSNFTNAHVEYVNMSNYSLKVCCLDPIDLTCNGTNRIMRLSNVTNAHVEFGEWVGGSNYGYDLCINGGISYVYGYGVQCPDGYQCLGSVPHYTNNHFGNCTAPAPGEYYKKMCFDNQPPVCELYWVNVTPTTCMLGNCTLGDNITITAEAAPNPGGCTPGQIRELHVSGFANASGLNCTIGLSNTSDIPGINLSISAPPFTFQEEWMITSVPPNCEGQQIVPDMAELWSDIEILATTTNITGNFTLKGSKVVMKCGNVSIDGDTSSFTTTCNVTSPPTNGSCSLLQCVYGNETTGDFIGCYDIGNVRANMWGEPIQCSFDQYWCPQYFAYNMSSGYCEPSLWTCDRGYPVAPPPGKPLLTCRYGDAELLYNNADVCLSDFVPPDLEFPFTQACCPATQWDGYFFLNAHNVVIY